MDTYFDKRLFVVWVILVGIAVAYLGIDNAVEHNGMPSASAVVTVSAICLALIKVWLIIREFMEVRGAPQLLRRIINFWVVVMAIAMLGTYLAGRAVA